MRMVIGHPCHKDRVSGYVLSDFAKAETDWLDDVLRGCSDGATALAGGDHARFSNAVAMRVAPPRPSTGSKPKPVSNKPAPAQEKAEADSPSASPLQRLMDRFK